MRQRARWSIVGAIACGAVAWAGWHAWETRFNVPVRLKAYQNTSTSEESVDTTLHEYFRGSDTTTGRSITFRSLKKDYAWEENTEGGPQYWIDLDFVRGKEGEYKGVRIHSPTKSISAVGMTYVGAEFAQGKVKSFGDLCGGKAFVIRTVRVVPPDKLPASLTGEAALLDPALELLVLFDRPGTRGFETAASCTAHSPICVVQMPYRSWMMAFHVQRPSLCDWPEMAADIRVILDEHVVGETPPRAE